MPRSEKPGHALGVSDNMSLEIQTSRSLVGSTGDIDSIQIVSRCFA